MTIFALTLVLTAAVLHATWNAMLKASSDKVSMLGLISVGHVFLGGTLALFVPIPAIESWPYLIGSTVIHFGYYYLLGRSYKIGDLSQVYPIARGIVPVFVTLGAQFMIGEVLPLKTWLGVLIVSAGIIMLSGDAIFGKTSRAVAFTAIATGLFIAAYTLTDGIGVRLAQASLGYIAWLFVLEVFVVVFVFGIRRHEIMTMPPKALLLGIVGGVVSATAYGMVIYAKEFTPLGLVSALRETSVLIAALIGVVIFGERPWRGRVFAAVVVVCGVSLIALF